MLRLGNVKLHLTNADISFMQSFRNPILMDSSFNHTNFSSLLNGHNSKIGGEGKKLPVFVQVAAGEFGNEFGSGGGYHVEKVNTVRTLRRNYVTTY